MPVLHAFAPHAYVIKRDDLRDQDRFTAIGPQGLLGNFAYETEALDAILRHSGTTWFEYGEVTEAEWGAWWPVAVEPPLDTNVGDPKRCPKCPTVRFDPSDTKLSRDEIRGKWPRLRCETCGTTWYASFAHYIAGDW